MSEQESGLKKVYFPNLNGLRFIAAFLVIIHHTEQLKSILGISNIWHVTAIQLIGKLGVVLFFVLSGFLITYLLLTEKQYTNTISIRNFYIRRILRIWPLYYLIILLGLLIFPLFSILSLEPYSNDIYINFLPKFILFIFFLPNLALVMYPPVPYMAQSWSIGVEEQFYIIWPFLIKVSKHKQAVLLMIIGLYLFFKIWGFSIIETLFYKGEYLYTIRSFWEHFNLDCMAIGGLFAFYLFNKKPIINLLFYKYVQVSVIGLIAASLILGIKVPYLHYEFYAILFGIILINLAANSKSILTLEIPFLSYLGKISYGLYMFNPLGIIIAIKVLLFFDIAWGGFIYILGTAITILISGFSYRFYEQYFIKRKVKYSRVISGDNVSGVN